MTAISLSIVVPAFNAGHELAESLPALKAAAPDVELLVVDDGSTDDTVRVAGTHGARVICLSCNGGPAKARNAGAAEASGSVLLFVDADVVVRSDSIMRIRRTFADNPDVAAVFGSYDSTPRADGLLSRYRNLLHHYVHQQGNPEAETFWAGLGAVRRTAFLAVGGFDAARFPAPAIEDIELGYRLRRAGHRIRIDKALQGTHLKKWTLGSMLRTDIAARAVPWTRLMLEGGAVRELNLQRDQRVSVVLTAVAAAAAVLGLVRPELWLVSIAAAAAVAILNRRFYAFLAREGGIVLALGSIPLHLLYFLYSGASFAYAYIGWRFQRTAQILRGRTGAVNS